MLHDTELTKELQAIRTRFVARIEEWLPGIEAVRADLNVGMFTRTDLKGLQSRLHKIAGSAGSFGFSRFSAAALALERQLETLRMTGHGIGLVAGMLPDFDVFLAEAVNLITTFRDPSPETRTNAAASPKGPALLDKPALLTVVPPSPTVPGPLILVVDDDDLMRDYVTKGLAANGWSCIEAGTGQGVLDCLNELQSDLRGRCPDLIILDVEMPDMDGFTTLSLLKDSPQWRNIPIMMLTAKDEDISFIRGYSKGATEYLTKPIELPVLAKVVRDLLSRMDLL